MRTQDILKLKDLAEESNISTNDVVDQLMIVQCMGYNEKSNSIEPTPMGYLAGIFDKTGVTTSIQLFESTKTHEVYLAYFQGNLMKFYKNIATGEIGADVDAMALTLGFNSAHELLSQDKTLDLLSEVKRQTGVWPISEV